MPRPNIPWFRTHTGWWYVHIGGKQRRLVKGRRNKRKALEKFHELLATLSEAPESPDARVVDICEPFLDYSHREHAKDTYRNHVFYIQSFCEAAGKVLVRELKPYHVSRWVDSKNWGETSRYNARRFVFRAFSYAVEEGMLHKNPLAGMRRPKPQPRQRAMTDEEFEALSNATDDCFRPFLIALRETGARPKELRELLWEQLQGDRFVIWKHKTDKSTPKPRVIYLNDEMKELLAALPTPRTGHVFLNSRGVPWTRDSVGQRIGRLKKKLGLKGDVCAYLVRHAFGTHSLVNGVSHAMTAELMGNSPAVVRDVYAHLADQHSHLLDAVKRATNRPKPRAAG